MGVPEISRRFIRGAWRTAEATEGGGGGSQPGSITADLVSAFDDEQTNSPPSGLATIDGAVASTGDRVLLAAQDTPQDNGLWVVDTGGAWTRPGDWQTGATIPSGTAVTVGDPASSPQRYFQSIWVLAAACIVDADAANLKMIAGAGALAVIPQEGGPTRVSLAGNELDMGAIVFAGDLPATNPGAGFLWVDPIGNIVKLGS